MSTVAFPRPLGCNLAWPTWVGFGGLIADQNLFPCNYEWVKTITATLLLTSLLALVLPTGCKFNSSGFGLGSKMGSTPGASSVAGASPVAGTSTPTDIAIAPSFAPSQVGGILSTKVGWTACGGTRFLASRPARLVVSEYTEGIRMQVGALGHAPIAGVFLPSEGGQQMIRCVDAKTAINLEAGEYLVAVGAGYPKDESGSYQLNVWSEGNPGPVQSVGPQIPARLSTKDRAVERWFPYFKETMVDDHEALTAILRAAPQQLFVYSKRQSPWGLEFDEPLLPLFSINSDNSRFTYMTIHGATIRTTSQDFSDSPHGQVNLPGRFRSAAKPFSFFRDRRNNKRMTAMVKRYQRADFAFKACLHRHWGHKTLEQSRLQERLSLTDKQLARLHYLNGPFADQGIRKCHPLEVKAGPLKDKALTELNAAYHNELQQTYEETLSTLRSRFST